MNDGAAAATGDVLVFLHADTNVPNDAVAVASQTLSKDDRVVIGGFVSLITTPNRTFWAMSLHNVLKTFYCPLLFQPAAFVKVGCCKLCRFVCPTDRWITKGVYCFQIAKMGFKLLKNGFQIVTFKRCFHSRRRLPEGLARALRRPGHVLPSD